MPKSRFTSSDVRAIVRDLRVKGVAGMRVVNVYDLDAKTYLLKLATPGVAEKVVILLESGIRFHSTRFDRDKGDMPSGFSVKLRKHIRAKRLEDISQLGVDRVVDFRFGSGENCNHVILELYASGNIVLTDHKYEILALLRTHKFEENVLSAVRELYPIEHATTLTSEEGSAPGELAAGSCISLQDSTPEELQAWIAREVTFGEAAKTEALAAGGKAKGGGGKKATLKLLMTNRGSGISQYGTEIITHCILHAGLDPNRKLSTSKSKSLSGEQQQQHQLLTLEECTGLLSSMREAPKVYAELDAPGQKGFILARGDEVVTLDDGTQVRRYEDVLPHLLRQHRRPPHGGGGGGGGGGAGGGGGDGGRGGGGTSAKESQKSLEVVSEFSSFDEAVDEYFSKLEEHKLAQAADSAENAIRSKVEKIRGDQRARLEALENAEALARRRAELLEKRADDVEKVITVLRSAMKSGIGWGELTDYVVAQQDLGNPIALMVHALRLETNTVVVLLEDDEAAESAPAVAVDIDLTKSAHANARGMFADMKVAQSKKEKTAEAAARVVDVAEKQSVDQLKQHYSKRQLKVVRKPYWFEKFAWFVTSENYLCVAGRDAQMNDLLVKRYLKPGDAYVHADVYGAASCVLVNKDPKGVAPLSPLALTEAGNMTVCRSAAWKSKMIASAWWVHAHQVSKTAPTGEYLSTGSFMIRGKKNFLPPSTLEMGFGLLFKLDEDSLAAHADERRERTNDEEEEEEEEDDAGANEGPRHEGPTAGGGAGAAAAAAAKPKFVKVTKQERRLARAAAAEEEEEEEEAREGHDGVEEAAVMHSGVRQGGEDAAAGAAAAAAADPEGRSGEREGGAEKENVGLCEGREVARNLVERPETSSNEGDDREEESSSECATMTVESNASGSCSSSSSSDGSSVSGRGESVSDMTSERSAPHLTSSSVASGAGSEEEGGGVRAKFATPRERKLMKKRGVTLEALRAEEARQRQQQQQQQQEEEEKAAAAATGGRGGLEREEADDDESVAAASDVHEEGGEGTAKEAARNAMRRGKKGKAKRVKAKYRDRDDEDLEVHKIAVGHVQLQLEEEDEDDNDGRGGAGDKGGEAMRRARTRETISKVLQGGGDVSAAVAALCLAASSKLHALCERGALSLPEDLDVFAVNSLAALQDELQVQVLERFGEAELGQIGNKSGLLTGIMRRLVAQAKPSPAESASGGGGDSEGEGPRAEAAGVLLPGRSAARRRDPQQREAEEVKQLLAEEGVVVADEDGGDAAAVGSYVHDLNKLTGSPLPSDTLLFTVPVCGPYAALTKYKYRVKLTPGEGKKGRTGKQALEVFVRNKECTPREKDLIKMISDNEVVQAIIGDVKMSTPGLNAVHAAKRSAKKVGKQKKPKN